MSAIPAAARHAVHERDRQCVRCGVAIAALHHRLKRREGGHGLATLIGLCNPDHAWVHAHPKLARTEGFIVPTWADPETVAVRHFSGMARWQCDDGTITWGGPFVPNDD